MAKKIETYTAVQQTGMLLNANECSCNLSDDILEEISDAVREISFNRYPDIEETELLEAYSRVCGVPKEQLLAGNGSDQMLGLLIGTFLGKGKKLYTFDPDFSMYDYYASSYEADVIKYELRDDGSLDLQSFIDYGRNNKADMVMFSNPNNPSGHCLSIDEIKQLLEAFPDIPVVVDEAYMEFSDEVSALTCIDSYENLYVTRTLSKAYALAGARVGFLASGRANMDRLKPTAVPYALNSISMKIACIVLAHADEIQHQTAELKERRKLLYEEVKKFKSLHFWNSQANFLHGRCEHKDRLLELFEKNHIVIRNYAGKDTFRITVGSESEIQAVLSVLRAYEEEFA